MLSWFDASEFQRFGEQLAAMVDTMAAAQGKRKRKTPQEVMRRLVVQIEAFRTRNGANFYKKAKFGNAFKWKLLDAGYDPVFVDELTKELMIHFR